MSEVRATKAYFIKLGKGGEWEEECILHDNTIKLGFNNPLHEECLAGEWDQVHKYWMGWGKSKGEATKTTNQIKAFYESDDETLWITFFRRRLYWCFAEEKVTQGPDGTRIRPVKGKWSYQDTYGVPLTLDNLSGKLTKVQGFRGTICTVREFEYLIRRLNHKKLPAVQKAEDTLTTLFGDIEPLIQNLTWKDFELLVDLIFTHAGWQRTSVVGSTQKTIDITMISPVTGNRAFVQVKSKASMSNFESYIEEYREMDEFDEMYFVVHTKDGSFEGWQDTPDIKLWDVEKLSRLVVNSGLVSWLMKKAS